MKSQERTETETKEEKKNIKMREGLDIMMGTMTERITEIKKMMKGDNLQENSKNKEEKGYPLLKLMKLIQDQMD